MNQNVQQLHELLKRSSHIVFFGGAGVSTASNIPDFRSDEGLYSGKEQKKYPYPPETMLSHTFFVRHTEQFFEYYFDKMVYPDAKPNPAHIALAKLEEMGRLSAVITQNIDGLHQAAGSREVLELHGSVLRNHCMRCGKFYGMDAILNSVGVPKCSCGGVIKPDVVLYEEGLDMDTLNRAVNYISRADVLIVGGTSLTVYPAAGLIDYYRGRKLVLINRDATPLDGQADLVIAGKIGEVLGEAVGL